MDAESDVIKNCTLSHSSGGVEECTAAPNSINCLRYAWAAWYRGLVIPKCSVLDPGVQMGKVGNMLVEERTTEYLLRIHDLNIINWRFRDSTCLVVVVCIRVSGGAACLPMGTEVSEFPCSSP